MPRTPGLAIINLTWGWRRASRSTLFAALPFGDCVLETSPSRQALAVQRSAGLLRGVVKMAPGLTERLT
jgi:hypothetical protein